MQLVQKGQSAPLPQLTGLTVTLRWSVAADFDIAALYRRADGTEGLAYFGERSVDGLALSEDKGVGDTGGSNEETLTVHDLAGKTEVHLLCWDYGRVQTGAKARFSESDVSIDVVDNHGTHHNVRLEAGLLGNVCAVASIMVDTTGARLVNVSNAGTLKGLTDTAQLWAVVNP